MADRKKGQVAGDIRRKHMKYRCIINPKVMLCLMLLLVCAGCVALGYNPKAQFLRVDKVELPKDMTAYKDDRMSFLLPPGWTPAKPDPPFAEETWQPSTAQAVFQKGDRGIVKIWCFIYNSDPYVLYRRVAEYAPMNEHIKSIRVKTSDEDLSICVRKATHVQKGEKKEFAIFTVEKRPPFLDFSGCSGYMLFGRSASSEFTEEVEKDIIVIVHTFKTFKK